MMKFMMYLLFMILVSFNCSYWILSLMILLLLMMMMFVSIDLGVSSLSYIFGFDLLSWNFIFLTLWICFLMLISSGNLFMENNWGKLFIFLVSLILFILFMIFVSVNMFVFYIFFEISLIPMLVMIIGWGYQPERLQAGFYMLMYTFFASLPMMIMIFMLFKMSGSMMFNFMMMKFSLYMFMCMCLIFLIKFPMYFVHMWLPKAHVEAPISGSMILAGVMLKLGGYGLMRLLKVMGSSVQNYYLIFIVVSLMGGFYVSLICMRQFDMKSLIAYSSISHMSLVISGSLTINYMGMYGSLILMLSHGLCSSGLFCLSNILYERTYSRSFFLNKGMMMVIPSLGLWWFIFCSFNMAAPPSLNLFSELLLIINLFSWCNYLLIILSLISFFSACYSLYLYSMVQHGHLMSSLYYFWMVNLREHMLLFLHLFPLFLYMFINF